MNKLRITTTAVIGSILMLLATFLITTDSLSNSKVSWVVGIVCIAAALVCLMFTLHVGGAKRPGRTRYGAYYRTEGR